LEKITGKHQGVTVQLEFDDRVYQPGSLTWALCDLISVRPGERVVDVGCGTGYLGLVAALLGAGEVVCIDPVAEALRWTRHNATLNGLDNIVTLQGDALELLAGEEADLILSLPPQMPYKMNFNPWRYGGLDGSDVVLKIIDQAAPILKPRSGRLYLIHAALANPARVRAALDRTSRSWQVVKTMEKELDPVEIDALQPGLYDYLLHGAQQGFVELEQRQGRYYYPVWFSLVQY
jgi:methylase of polypeptide subunit release factors